MKRREDESFEDYRERRKKEGKDLKTYLKGKVVYDGREKGPCNQQ